VKSGKAKARVERKQTNSKPKWTNQYTRCGK